MKLRILAALFVLLVGGSAHAGPFPVINQDVGVCDPNAPSHCIAPDASGNVPITGTITASLGGFTPSASGARMTALSVTTSDSSGNLPTGAVTVVSNVGTNPMYCNVNGVAATTSDQEITSGGGWFAFTIPAAVTTLHCIATGGSTTANGVGGSGLATGTGGGSGGGGGGNVNVTQWDTTSLGVPTAYGVAPTTGNYIGVNAFVTNTNANGQAIAANSSPVVLPVAQVTADPCTLGTKTNFTIATSSGTVQLVAPSGSTQVYICSLFTIGATASIQNIVGGTGAACTTGTPVAIAGSTTAANGMSFAANGGFTFGNGGGTVLRTTTAGHGVCLIQSATAAIAGGGTFVQQ